MNGQQALFAFGREHEQFDLAAFNKTDHLVVIATSADVGVSGNLDGAEIHGLALQRITQLLFKLLALLPRQPPFRLP